VCAAQTSLTLQEILALENAPTSGQTVGCTMYGSYNPVIFTNSDIYAFDSNSDQWVVVTNANFFKTYLLYQITGASLVEESLTNTGFQPTDLLLAREVAAPAGIRYSLYNYTGIIPMFDEAAFTIVEIQTITGLGSARYYGEEYFTLSRENIFGDEIQYFTAGSSADLISMVMNQNPSGTLILRDQRNGIADGIIPYGESIRCHEFRTFTEGDVELWELLVGTDAALYRIRQNADGTVTAESGIFTDTLSVIGLASAYDEGTSANIQIRSYDLYDVCTLSTSSDLPADLGTSGNLDITGTFADTAGDGGGSGARLYLISVNSTCGGTTSFTIRVNDTLGPPP
jgi:hypothetical protein